MGNNFLGLSYETWGGVLLAGVIIPILWWLIRKLLDYIRNRKSISLVLKGIANNSEPCHIFVRDMEVELHQDPKLNYVDRWPLLDRAPRRLGGQIEGRGPNIPIVWADSDATAIADVLNVLGQVGKRNNIRLVKRSEDEGERDCHMIVVGGQDQNAQHFYSSMTNVFYRMTTSQIIDANTNQPLQMDTNYGYGLILKATNPHKTTGSHGVAILVGGFGVLGTLAAAYYLRTRISEIAKTFGGRNFGIVVRCRKDNPPEAVERLRELDRPSLTLLKRLVSWLK
jgi:hypothetical protein